jgi:hypothetical protein
MCCNPATNLKFLHWQGDERNSKFWCNTTIWMIKIWGYCVYGALTVIILAPKNHLLSCSLSFTGVHVMGGRFFRQQTTLLRMCEGLGISTKLFVFLLCERELHKWWSWQGGETTKQGHDSKLSRFFLVFVFQNDVMLIDCVCKIFCVDFWSFLGWRLGMSCGYFVYLQ